MKNKRMSWEHQKVRVLLTLTMCRHTNTTGGSSDLRSVRTHLLSCVTETKRPTCPLKNTLQSHVTEQEVTKTRQVKL